MSKDRSMDRWLDRIVNLAVLAIIGIALFRPGGWVGRRIVDWRQDQVRERVVREARKSGNPGDETPVILEFVDYQCPFCRQAEDSIRIAMERFDFRVEYRHLPLTAIHPRAEEAALVAICAERQGVFEDVHSLLFSSDAWVDHERIQDWQPLTRSIPDSGRFDECLDGNEARARLAADMALANGIGLRGTPSFASVLGVQTGLPTVEAIRRLAGVD